MSVLTEYFSHTYIINLPSRSDRRREVVKELARADIQLDPGRVEIFPALRPPDRGDFVSVGARGCFLSHLEALRAAQRRGAQNVLVIEDDLAVSSKLAGSAPAIVKSLSAQPWALVYLGHTAQALPVSPPEPLVRADEETLCAHFYGVSGAALPGLIRYLEAILARPAGHPDGGPMHYDGALTTFRRDHPGQTLFASPNLGWQRSSASDISGDGWSRRLPLVPTALAWLRRGRNQWRRFRSPDGA
jgi:glycosyl transferase family 25